jgi:hypothetical protein
VTIRPLQCSPRAPGRRRVPPLTPIAPRQESAEYFPQRAPYKLLTFGDKKTAITLVGDSVGATKLLVGGRKENVPARVSPVGLEASPAALKKMTFRLPTQHSLAVLLMAQHLAVTQGWYGNLCLTVAMHICETDPREGPTEPVILPGVPGDGFATWSATYGPRRLDAGSHDAVFETVNLGGPQRSAAFALFLP